MELCLQMFAVLYKNAKLKIAIGFVYLLNLDEYANGQHQKQHTETKK